MRASLAAAIAVLAAMSAHAQLPLEPARESGQSVTPAYEGWFKNADGSIGFLLGLANGISKFSEQLTDTTLQMVRNIPHLALIPLVILWFGIDESAKLFLVALGVFFPIYLNTLHGIRTVDPQLIEMGRIYGMTEANCSAG